MNSKLIMPPALIRSYESIQVPSRTVAFLDARVSAIEPKVDVQQLNTDLGQPSAFATRFAPRHSRGGNLAFCDGHVEWQPGAEVVETRIGRSRGFARFPDGTILWCPDPWMDPNTPD